MAEKKRNPADIVEPHSRGIPTDRGWAWVILGAVWFNQFLCVGVYKALGILFVEFQRKYSSSSSVTSLIFSLLNFGVSITSICMLTFGLNYVTTRQSVMAGSIIVCSANIMAALAGNIEVIIISQGLLVGIGQGLMFATALSLLGRYFKRRIGLANCLAATGGSVGSLIFPIILRSCLDEFSLFGTFLILGAIFLQGMVSAALLRPTEYYTAGRSRSDGDNSGTQQSVQEVNSETNDNDSGIFVKSVLVSNQGHCPGSGDEGESEVSASQYLLRHPSSVPDGCRERETQLTSSKPAGNSPQSSPFSARAILARNRRHDTVDSQSQRSKVIGLIDAISDSNIARYTSNEFFSSALDLHTDLEDGIRMATESSTKPDKHDTKSGCLAKDTCLSKFVSVFDCSVLRRLPFLFFIPCAGLLCSACSMVQTFLPPLGTDQGLTDSQTSRLITVVGAVDLVAIIIWGVVADTGWIKRHHMISLTVGLLGVATFCMPLYTTFDRLVGYCVIYGLFGRIYLSLYPVVLVDFLGVEKLRGSLGITVLTHAMSLAVMLPILGYIRDSTGTYISSFHVIASFMVIGGLGILTLPLAERLEKRLDKKKQNDGVMC